MKIKKPNRLMAILKHPMLTAIIGTLIGTLIGSIVAYYFTATSAEKATVELMAKRLEIVEENDTLEEAINKVNKVVEEKEKEIDKLSGTIKEQDQQISDLTKQVNDDTEIKKLNGQIEDKQKVVDKLQKDVDNLQKEKEELQAEYDKLLKEGYEAYLLSRQTMPISLSSIEPLKNEGVRTDHSGSVTAGGDTFSYYIDTYWKDEAYIEYNLDNKYSQFKGMVYVSKWAYINFDADSPVIGNASISLQVKYNNADDYQELAKVSGLSGNSDPVEIGCILTGVTRFKIVFRGCGAYASGDNGVIHLGEPVFYKTAS